MHIMKHRIKKRWEERNLNRGSSMSLCITKGFQHRDATPGRAPTSLEPVCDEEHGIFREG